MSIFVWIIFLLFIGTMVALDLGVFHREVKTPTLRDAVGWTIGWVSMAMSFNIFVYFLYQNDWSWASLSTEHLTGNQAASQYLLGYVLELSLSVDNIFVIALIFAYFRVPVALQHRVLFWGILGAVVLRLLFISLGVALINQFEWIAYVFGALLFYSAGRMLMMKHHSIEPDENALFRLAQRFLPITNTYHGTHFFIERDGRKVATPLFLALLLVESSDVMFAIDSIPAIFAVTRDPFIAFTSNIFAILGLRSLYFVLVGYLQKFHYLKHAMVFILAFVGVKIMLSNHYHIPEEISLSVVFGCLLIGILVSVLHEPKEGAEAESWFKH